MDTPEETIHVPEMLEAADRIVTMDISNVGKPVQYVNLLIQVPVDWIKRRQRVQILTKVTKAINALMHDTNPQTDYIRR
jgi:hypothetical protein